MKAIRILIGVTRVGILVFLFWPLTSEGEIRIWTDVSGRTIEAEAIGVDHAKGFVRLKMENGNEILFHLKRLSVADQQFVSADFAIDPVAASREIDRLIRQRLDQPPRGNGQSIARHSAYLANLEAMAKPMEPLTDEGFLQRIYPSIAGRDPTAAEIAAFRADLDPNKRGKLIDGLIESDDFVNHFLEFLSPLLRIGAARPKEVAYSKCGRESGQEKIVEAQRDRYPAPPPERYRDWVKEQIRKDRPWDELMNELLTATGKYSDNPATGYLLADHGPGLVDPSHTMTAIAGVEITCALCHDHPYEEIYRGDFYKVAAFFGGLQFKTVDGKLFSIDAELVDGPGEMTLPADYQYRDFDPGDRVSPEVYFGEVIDLKAYQTPRVAFAAWLTSESNPRFTVNLVNRLWKHVYGTALVEPVYNLPGHLGDTAHDLKLLNSLAKLMRETDFRIKDFLKILYKTETFSGIKS